MVNTNNNKAFTRKAWNWVQVPYSASEVENDWCRLGKDNLRTKISFRFQCRGSFSSPLNCVWEYTSEQALFHLDAQIAAKQTLVRWPSDCRAVAAFVSRTFERDDPWNPSQSGARCRHLIAPASGPTICYSRSWIRCVCFFGGEVRSFRYRLPLIIELRLQDDYLSQNFHHSFSTGSPFFDEFFVTFPIKNCFQ